jgi:hypothetical protein
MEGTYWVMSTSLGQLRLLKLNKRMHWTIEDVNVAIRLLISITLSYSRRERGENYK